MKSSIRSINIKSKAVSSFLWSAIEQFGSQGLSLIITIIIARLVTPQDYGLIAMLSIFMALSQVFINSGFSNYLIQNKNRDKLDYNTVFYLNVIIGLICYLILFIFSRNIASFYHQPILKSIIRLYSLTLIISSLTLVQRAIIYINYQYKKLSIITIISLLFSGTTAIYLASIGWGVWTLVAYQLIEAFSSSVLIWLTSKWHPTLNCSFDSARKAFLFGSKLLGANILSSGVSNLYTLVIGRSFQATELGYYSRGQSLAIVFPSNFANMIQKASYPILCENQDQILNLKRIFKQYVLTSAIICFPLMLLLFSVSEPLIKLLLTDKWLDAVPFLQIICLGSLLDPIMRLNSIILSVTGKTHYSLYSEIIKKIVLIILLFISLPFGIIWVAVGAALYPLFDLFIVSFFVKKIIPFTLKEEIKLILPILFLSLISYICIYPLNKFIINDLFKLLTIIPTYLVIFFISIRIFFPQHLQFLLTRIKSIARR